jgi:hypothetical protein
MYFITKSSSQLDITEMSQNALEQCGLGTYAKTYPDFLENKGLQTITLASIIPGIVEEFQDG